MKKDNERKIDFRIDDPDILESLLASGTWRPGKAKPPLSMVREAWLKCTRNSWVKSLIFMAGGSGFTYIFSKNQTIESFILAVGAGVVAGIAILSLFFLTFLAKEVYLRGKKWK